MVFRREDGSGANEAAILALRGRGELLLLHEQLVGKRLYINAQIRFLVVMVIIGGALAARHVLRVEGLDVASLVLLAALLGLFNTGVYLLVRRHKRLERRVPVYRFLMGMMHLTIDVDFLFLTATVWLVGGAKSPFLSFYLLHVILAAALLSPRAAYAHALFGYALLCSLVLGEWWGVIPACFPVGAVNSTAPLNGQYVLTVLVVQGTLMVLAVYLLTGLTGLLRRGEQQLRASNTELARLSRVQRDFLHIALHDLKAPVTAATMLVHALKIGSDSPLSEVQERRVERILTRLNEVSAFLHDLGVLAALDSADFNGQAGEIDVAELLKNAVAENQDLVRMHQHTVRVEVPDGLPRLRGAGRLIHEAVVNLLTNAVKYTPDSGTIVVRVRCQDAKVHIEVQDNGIGIAPEDQKRLFREFVRIRRKDSPLADVAGSGLGLSIVRRIVEAHDGHVGVVSELGKGSTFFIELPVPRAGENGFA